MFLITLHFKRISIRHWWQGCKTLFFIQRWPSATKVGQGPPKIQCCNCTDSFLKFFFAILDQVRLNILLLLQLNFFLNVITSNNCGVNFRKGIILGVLWDDQLPTKGAGQIQQSLTTLWSYSSWSSHCSCYLYIFFDLQQLYILILIILMIYIGQYINRSNRQKN